MARSDTPQKDVIANKHVSDFMEISLTGTGGPHDCCESAMSEFSSHAAEDIRVWLGAKAKPQIDKPKIERQRLGFENTKSARTSVHAIHEHGVHGPDARNVHARPVPAPVHR